MFARSTFYLAFLLPFCLATNTTPSCAQQGIAYNDMYRNATVNGAFQVNAATCQAVCKATLFCAYFTYYSNTGGCWLQGNQVSSFPSPNAVSGPVACEGEESTSAYWNQIEELENGTAHFEPLPVAKVASEATSKNLAVGSTIQEGSSSGFPWWGWAIGGASAALVSGGAAYYFAESKKKRNFKRGAHVSSEDVESSATISEALVSGMAAVPTYPMNYYTNAVTLPSSYPQVQPIRVTYVASPLQKTTMEHAGQKDALQK